MFRRCLRWAAKGPSSLIASFLIAAKEHGFVAMVQMRDAPNRMSADQFHEAVDLCLSPQLVAVRRVELANLAVIEIVSFEFLRHVERGLIAVFEPVSGVS